MSRSRSTQEPLSGALLRLASLDVSAFAMAVEDLLGYHVDVVPAWVYKESMKTEASAL